MLREGCLRSVSVHWCIVICRTSVCAACSHSQSLSSRDCRRGCGARCRRWAPLSLCSGRRSSESLQKGLRRALSPLGPPLSLQWQAQYPEPPEGAAARVVAAGPPSLSAVAGAVPKASRRGCGARCRRWAPLALCSGRRSTQSLQKGLRRALSPLGPPRSLQWQAQYPEPPEGAAARVVAAGPPAVLCVTAILICKAMVAS